MGVVGALAVAVALAAFGFGGRASRNRALSTRLEQPAAVLHVAPQAMTKEY
jgi:hypothetical protein